MRYHRKHSWLYYLWMMTIKNLIDKKENMILFTRFDCPSHLRKKTLTCFLILFLALSSSSAFAQFSEPEFEKVNEDQRTWFQNKFENVKWTGQGLYDDTDLDDRQTNEIRARLQSVYGDPTQTLEDLIDQEDFRPGMAIQFEYWFTVDDSIPMMVLDVDGPFSNGLVFGGASKYIDLMPQIKRTFSQKLLKAESLDSYQDYFYSPERQQWFNVVYENGQYKTTEIESPDGMNISFN